MDTLNQTWVMDMDPIVKGFLDLGVAGVALYALVLMIRSRSAVDQQSSKQESDIIAVMKQLVNLVGSFMDQTKQTTVVLESLVKRADQDHESLNLQTTAISANTGAVLALGKNIKDDFMPTLASMLSSHQKAILEEFRPVTERLSAIGLGMDALNKALLLHRESETKVMVAVQEQQRKLYEELLTAEKTLQSIFERVMETPQTVVPEPLPHEEIPPTGVESTIVENTEGVVNDVQAV